MDPNQNDVSNATDVNPADRASSREYEPTAVVRHEHSESMSTRLIEQQAAKLPSDFFLFGALGVMAASLALELAGRPRLGRFVGMWPPAILTMGIYNKLIKLMGSR